MGTLKNSAAEYVVVAGGWRLEAKINFLMREAVLYVPYYEPS